MSSQDSTEEGISLLPPCCHLGISNGQVHPVLLRPDPPQRGVVVAELVHPEHLVEDLQLLPPAPLLLLAAELVEGDLRHELPRLHTRSVVRGLQHLAAVFRVSVCPSSCQY